MSAVHKDATHLHSYRRNNELNEYFFVKLGLVSLLKACCVCIITVFHRFIRRTTEVMDLCCPYFSKEDNVSKKVVLSHLMTSRGVIKVHFYHFVPLLV